MKCVKGCGLEWLHDGPCDYSALHRDWPKVKLPETATGEALDRLAEQFGVDRREPVVAHGEASGFFETDEELRARIEALAKGVPAASPDPPTDLDPNFSLGDAYFRGAASAARYRSGDWHVVMTLPDGSEARASDQDLFWAVACCKLQFEAAMKRRLTRKRRIFLDEAEALS